MAIRMSGLSSGLDTESIVSALTQSYKSKIDKYKKAQTKLSWKQDAWKSANKKIYSLYNSVSSMRFTSAYNLNTTSVSDTTKATVTASSDALVGTQSLKVKQLAKTGYLTGAKLADTTASSTLSSLGFSGDGSIAVTTASGTKNVSVSGSTTISEFVNKLKDAGVKANYDATNKRIFVSAADSGAENDFTLTGANSAGTEALTALGLNFVSNATDANGNYVDPTYRQYQNLASYKTAADAAGSSLEDYVSGILTQMGEAYSAKSEATTNSSKATAELNYAKAYQTMQSYANDSNAEALAEIKDLYTTYTSNRDSTYVVDGQAYTSVEEVKDEDGNVTGYKYTGKDADGNEVTYESAEKLQSVSDQIEDLAKTAGLITTSTDEDGNEISDKSGLTAYQSALNTVSDYELNYADNVERVQNAAANGTLADTVTEIQSEIDGYNATITASNATLNQYADFGSGASYTDPTSDAFASAVSSYVDKINSAVEALAAGPTTSGASRIYGQDAIIELNDVEFTGSSNSITVNGLTITALAETAEDEPLTITTTRDVQGLYDKIKDFLSSYNEVVNELVSLYNADSAKGYEPLTDDEKESMTDSQIEKWESKIKDSLLRKDGTLNDVINTMTNSMFQSYEIDGKKISLSTFGISTLGILGSPENEQYAYHIDGDADDSLTSGNKDKLLAALQDNADQVVDFMKQLADGLYKNLDKKMKSTSLKSMYNVYNDKEMATEYSDYTDLISEWETRLADAESRYFKQFSAMESALSTMNANSSSLTSMLG